MNNLKGTTIVACKRDGKTVIGADSQATLDTMVFKDGVKKLYRIYNDEVIVGMAGTVSHNLAVLRLLEENLNKYCGKGSKILVHGELRTSNYKDKDNKTVYKTYVLVNEIEFLDGKPKAKEEIKKETSVTNDMQVYEDFGKEITDEMLPF